MRKLVLFLHASLDGFVEGPNGEMDIGWVSYDADLEKHAKEILSTADTVIWGRGTYQMMHSYWPSVPSDQQYGVCNVLRQHILCSTRAVLRRASVAGPRPALPVTTSAAALADVEPADVHRGAGDREVLKSHVLTGTVLLHRNRRSRGSMATIGFAYDPRPQRLPTLTSPGTVVARSAAVVQRTGGISHDPHSWGRNRCSCRSALLRVADH